MNTVNDIFRSLGRIEGKLGRVEGELIEIHKVSERVSRLEQMQFWLKGGWAALAAACTYLCKGIYAK
jgi:hypothetical protein